MASRRQPFPASMRNSRVMVFVDGENLAIRYGEKLGNSTPFRHINFEKDVFVWSPYLNFTTHKDCDIIRRYYYTSVMGDEKKQEEIHDRLRLVEIEAPRVFKRHKKRGSKRVDISLAVDMLTHASRKNYDLAVLVAGDEDYVPLVDAIMAEGCRVCLWFLENGLSPILRRQVDLYFDIGHVLFEEDPGKYFSG